MTRKTRGFRARTRNKLGQKVSYRPTITKFLQEFRIGQDVIISLEPSSQKGMPFPRFKGKIGKIVGKRGSSYLVEVNDGNMMKIIVSRPEHLRVA
jgi:large subunit ribosomal protein L21e